MYKLNQNNENVVLHCVKYKTHYHFQLYSHNVEQHTRDKWLIHGVKCRKNKRMPQKHTVAKPGTPI